MTDPNNWNDWTIVFDNVEGVPPGHRVRGMDANRPPGPEDRVNRVVFHWVVRGFAHFEPATPEDATARGPANSFAEFVAEWSRTEDPGFNTDCLF